MQPAADPGLEPEPEPEPAGGGQRRSQHGHALSPASFPCRFYPRGRCQKGDTCKFRHDPALLQQPKATQPDPTLATHGPAELTETLGAALLCQWRGDGKHKACTHGFHSRKAVMNPLAVTQLLQLLPGEGAVLDPFVGSGTTMIEVMIGGRPAVGYDVSPLAVGIANYHCWRPPAAQLDELRMRVAAVIAALPDDDTGAGSDGDAKDAAAATVPPEAAAGRPNDTIDWEDAARVVSEQAGKSSLEVEGALHFLFSHEQLYEWPAWRRQRSLAWRFQRTAERYMEKLTELAAAVPLGTAQAEVFVTDARSVAAGQDQSGMAPSADGVLTSPPYPGVYNYVADESDGRGLSSWATRARVKTAGLQAEVSYASLCNSEIGSQKQREDLDPDAFAQRWQADTEAWLRACADQLRPGGRIVMLIGDNAGVDALESIRAAAGSIHGVEPNSGCSSYDLRLIASASVAEDARRPWSSKKRNYRSEHTILLEKVLKG